jgi:hypothetical protein
MKPAIGLDDGRFEGRRKKMTDENVTSDDYESEKAWHRELRLRPKENELIWHYTGWKAMVGILANNELWASDARYLNDTREVVESKELVKSPDLQGDNLTGFREALDKQGNVAGFGVHGGPFKSYVVSFSKAFDSIGQWRGYSGWGPPISIGFRRAGLEKLAEDHGLQLNDCVYTAADRRELIEQVKALYPGPYLSGSSSSGAYINQLHLARRWAVRFKHPSFKDEKEVRLYTVYMPGYASDTTPKPQKEDFFLRGSLPVPYVRLPPIKEKESRPLLPIESILVGPTPHGDAAVRQIEELTANAGNISVHESWISYRNW